MIKNLDPKSTVDDATYEVKSIELEDELKPVLTDEFLSVLVKASKTCGWSVDHSETVDFVEWCFDIAGKKRPEDLSPLLDIYL